MNLSSEQVTQELAAIAHHLRRSTVQVRSRQTGSGSGVIWSEDGVIITNAHVVRGSSAEVELWDGRVLPASVTARNAQRDLVALKVSATDLPAAAVGDSTHLRIGELVLAVGNPWGLTGAATTGIIHSLGSSQSTQPSWVQADIQLAPGNSGGPLANARGEVIGINTMIVNGCGFAVPSHAVRGFLHNAGESPYLGVTLQLVRIPMRRRGRFGLLITAVESNSPAAGHLQMGDVLIGIRGRLFQTPDELFRVLENSQVGDGLALDVMRGDRLIVANIVLWNRDDQAKAA